MFYPGCAVYVPDEKKIGIYLTYDPPKGYNGEPFFYVYLGIGEDLSECDTCIFDSKEIIPISLQDKKSRTGQVMYRTPFQKDGFNKTFSKKEAEDLEERFKEEIRNLLSQKRIREHYEIDLRSGLKDPTPITSVNSD